MTGMINRFFIVLLLVYVCPATGRSQPGTERITTAETKRILEYLSADSMRGRRAFTPDIDRAAAFIAQEFGRAGLRPLPGASGFLQEFTLLRPLLTRQQVTAGKQPIDSAAVLVVTTQDHFAVQDPEDWIRAEIRGGQNLQAEARRLLRQGKNAWVRVDRSFAGQFGNLARLRNNLFPQDHSLVFILADTLLPGIRVEAWHQLRGQTGSNVVGYIPGRSRTDEYIVFSGHYDHLGVGRPVNGDSVYNGANDDASGITAVIQLARYFREQGAPERSLLFAAFTAEEVGGFGSQYFSRQLDPARVSAMINIEMIGTESKWGKNSAYITGYEQSSLGPLLAARLAGTPFSFYPDPYPQQQLFYRSDNATLARLGVPAHTISSSKMDVEPHYHKPSDEVATLDIENMNALIRAIALSVRHLVTGQETPTRVNTAALR